jgi:hypothetical protein
MQLELTDCLSRCQPVYAQNLDSVRVNALGGLRAYTLARLRCEHMTSEHTLSHVRRYSPSPHLSDSFLGVEKANFEAGALALRAVI